MDKTMKVGWCVHTQQRQAGVGISGVALGTASLWTRPENMCCWGITGLVEASGWTQ